MPTLRARSLLLGAMPGPAHAGMGEGPVVPVENGP